MFASALAAHSGSASSTTVHESAQLVEPRMSERDMRSIDGMRQTYGWRHRFEGVFVRSSPVAFRRIIGSLLVGSNTSATVATIHRHSPVFVELWSELGRSSGVVRPDVHGVPHEIG